MLSVARRHKDVLPVLSMVMNNVFVLVNVYVVYLGLVVSWIASITDSNWTLYHFQSLHYHWQHLILCFSLGLSCGYLVTFAKRQGTAWNFGKGYCIDTTT